MQGYSLNSDVYACISLIASAGKQVKWWDAGAKSKALTTPAERYKAYGYDASKLTVGSEDDRAAYIKLATKDPRPSIELLARAGGESFIEAWLSYLLIAGNNYIEIERKGDAVTGTPSMLYLQRPDRVKATVRAPGSVAPQMSESQLVDRWTITAYGKNRDVPADNMAHSKLFNPSDDIYGMAPLQAALLRVDAENEGLTLMKRMLQRGFAPGWIEAREDSTWGDTQVAALKERIKFSKTAGEELFLENAKWHQMGFTPVDAGVTEQQILSKRDIASVFHVPSQLIGDTQAQTYSNWQEARRALYMEAVIPLLTQFRGDWNRTIGKALNSPLDFDKDSFDAITAARQEATDRVVKLFTSGLITQAEGRNDLEYPPAQPGDVFYAPANLMPLGEKVL
jgi:HK97 family phage portal protein